MDGKKLRLKIEPPKTMNVQQRHVRQQQNTTIV
jgi:hypothetical protein